MAIKALRALQQFVIREIFKEAPTGVMRTLPNQELVDMNVQVLAQRLMQGGIDPTALKNANQVENALNMIESRPPVQQGITSTKSAKVFDMEGKEIPKGSKIMGGKAVKETEAEIAERIKRENKEAAERMRNKKFLEDYETSEAKLREKLNPKSTTSLDDPIKRVYEREKKEGKFENIRLRDGRKIESEEDFREYIDELNEDSNFADGGRIGYKDGPDQPGRRKFMKIMGGLAALPIVGKFFKGAKVAAPAAQAVKETVQQAPNYFFELADKIRRLGRESKVSPQERVREINYKGKDGSEYTLTEDMTTGDMQITKDRTGMAYSDEVGGYDVIEDRTVMEYKSGKGMADESTGAKVADEYEEYKVEFDPDGTPADATDVDEITKTEIVKEVTDEAPSIKKAGGGIATMLGE
jgi:hypothetical protein